MVWYTMQPTYTFAPFDKIPEDMSFYLDDFEWHADIRPTRDSIFNRTIRPSERERIEAMSHPSFPIRAAINGDRKRLQSEGRWRDRSEHVSAAATLWMKGLVYPGTEA